jgi:hypothetical protein
MSIIRSTDAKEEMKKPSRRDEQLRQKIKEGIITRTALPINIPEPTIFTSSTSSAELGFIIKHEWENRREKTIIFS